MSDGKKRVRRMQIVLFRRTYSAHREADDRWTAPTPFKSRAERAAERLSSDGSTWTVVKFESDYRR